MLNFAEYQKRAKLTEAITRQVNGSPYTVTAVCAAAGIGVQSYYRWIRQGITDDQYNRMAAGLAKLATQDAHDRP